MRRDRKEIADLIGQHDAIRAQMKFLTESLTGLDVQSDLSESDSTRIKKTFQDYSYTLRDLRAGVISHITLDERIFSSLFDNAADKRLSTEHRKILELIDLAIESVDKANIPPTSRDELTRRVTEITAAIGKIRRLIKSHTSKEDKLLELS